MPNVILMVLDACRYDELSKVSSLDGIREENLWFESAVAPSNWSLPSHVSILDGSYPHQHGVLRAGDEPGSLTIPRDHFSETCCVSGNSFVSPSHGFDRFFDECHYTVTRKYARGRALSNYYSELRGAMDALASKDIGSAFRNLTDVALDAAKQPDRRYTVANVLLGLLQKATSDFDSPLNRIPRPMFNDFSVYGYRPGVNRELIRRRLGTHADSSGDLFIFANYMDTHRPYAPSTPSKNAVLDEALGYRDIARLNRRIADEWNFYEWLENDGDRDDLATVRALYRGSVRDAAQEVQTVVQYLDENEMRDETVLVVTSDHGEMLGGTGPLGLPSMGHSAGLSDELLQVPLMICHPRLEGRDVERPISLTDLAPLLTSSLENLISSGGRDLGPMEDGEIVGCEIPPRGIPVEEMRQRHPQAPERKLELEGELCTVVGYRGDWKMAALSSGETMVWLSGEQREAVEAPEPLRDWVDERLALLTDEVAGSAEVPRAHLEKLGYL